MGKTRTTLEKTTAIGLVLGFIFILTGIMISEGAKLSRFLDWPSVMITLGGTIASTLISYPIKILKNLPGILASAFQMKKIDLQADIDMIIEISNIARREGLLALEDAVTKLDDPFLKKGVMLIVDGSDPEFVKNVMEAEIYFIQERHGQGQAVLDSMAGFAPSFGMIGTLIGLIIMLDNLDDISALGPSMAVALITTLYGSILAYLVFTPLSKKLATKTAEEAQEKELLLEGLLSIQDGENPRVIRDKLNAFISRSALKKQPDQQAANSKPETEELTHDR